MIMVYLLLAFVPVDIAYMIISASKCNAVTKRAKRAERIDREVYRG